MHFNARDTVLRVFSSSLKTRLRSIPVRHRHRHNLRFHFTGERTTTSCDGRDRNVARVVKNCTRNPILRFFNPWVDVAHNMAKENRRLGTEVATYTETWGLVSVLLCGLSVTALVGMPSENKNGENYSGTSRSSLLVSWGLLSSLEQQHDAYIGSFASAFFTSASSLGVSTVLNVLASVTPNSHMRAFIIRHSWQLCAIPFVTAISGGFVGLALAIGIDLTNSPNVARIALGGFALTTLLVSSAAIHGQVGLYRALSTSSCFVGRKARVKCRQSSACMQKH